MLDEIFASFRSLVAFPHQGHRRPDLTSRPLRFRLVYEYLIAYASESTPLWIIAVLHGRRNPAIMRSILRERRETAQPQ